MVDYKIGHGVFLLTNKPTICLPQGVPASVVYHRVTSSTIVSSNDNPVFICFVSYLKCCILCVCYVAIKVLQVNS